MNGPARRQAPPIVLRAGLLVLRRWELDDLEDLEESVTTSRTHLAPWMSWAADYDRSGASAFFERAAAQWDERDDYGYALVAQGTVVGGAGLHARIGPGGLEIGYWVDVRHTRRGSATLAAAALTEAGLSIPGVEVIEIHHDIANTASAGVPRRLGFARIGERPDDAQAPGEDGVEVVWRMPAGTYQGSGAELILSQARAGRVG